MIPPISSALWRTSLVVALCGLSQLPDASALGDRFSYGTGDLLSVSGSLWTSAGGKSGPPLPVSVTSGQEIQIAAATTDFVKRAIPKIGDFVYLRLKLTVDTIPAAGTGDYFLALQDAASNRRCRLHIAQDTGGKFKLGVSFAAIPAPAGAWQTQLNPGQAYTVVVRLNRSSKNVSLWIDPSAEGSGAVTSTDTSSAFEYDSVVIRPSSLYGGSGLLRIDDLFVGSEWREVVGAIYDVTQNPGGPVASLNNTADNDLPGIQKSLDLAKADSGNAIVFLPTGTYHLSPASGTTTVSGTTVISGTETKFLGLVNADGVTVDGSGSTLVIRKSTAASGADTQSYQPATVLSTGSSQNLTVKELTVRWQRVPYSVATVSNATSVTPESTDFIRKYTFTATLDAGYPVPDPNGWMVGALSDVLVSGTNLVTLCNINAFQNKPSSPKILEANFVAASGTLPARYDVTLRMPKNAWAGARVNYDQSIAALDGRKVVLRHIASIIDGYPSIYGPNAFEISSCANVMLRDITLNASTGMGFKFYDSQLLTLRRVVLTPEAGKPLSSAVDGAFFTFCRRGSDPAVNDIVIDECTFRNTGDDSANIHAKFQQIVATPDLVNNKLLVKPLSGDTGPRPKVGDTYEFYTYDRQQRFASTAVVTSSTNVLVSGTKHLLLGFNSLPASPLGSAYPVQNDFLVSIENRPRLLVKDTLFEGSHARGLILSTDAPVVRNCTFRYIAYNGIFMIANPFGSGSQGPGPTGAVFDSNVFEGCGASAIATWSQSGTGAKATFPGAPGVNRDLTITSTQPQLSEIRREGPIPVNAYRPRITISGTDGNLLKSHYVQSGIYLQAFGSTHPSNLTNTIAIKMSGTSPSSGYEPAVFLNNVRQIKLYKVEAAGQLWRSTTDDLIDPPDFGDLPVSGPTVPDYLLLGDKQPGSLAPGTILGSPRQPSDLRP